MKASLEKSRTEYKVILEELKISKPEGIDDLKIFNPLSKSKKVCFY